MVCFLSGPTETILIGISNSFQKLTQLANAVGNSSSVLIWVKSFSSRVVQYRLEQHFLVELKRNVRSSLVLFHSVYTLYSSKAWEYVTFHHHELCDSVDANGVFKCHEVNPSTTSCSSGSCSKFFSNASHSFSYFIEQFCGERATADTSGIGFIKTSPTAFGAIPNCARSCGCCCWRSYIG